MQKLLETTGTLDGFRYPSNVYYLDEAGKLVGFLNEKGEEKLFTKPMMFDKRGRKFKKV